jgi:sterol desaturase/sphingolipid hydroxylase (fatty acid hydroxylase superfamily)
MTIAAIAVRFGAFPLLLTGATGLIYAAVRSGVSLDLVAIGAPVCAGAIIALAERVAPFERDWSTSKGDVGTDVFHLFVSMGLVPLAYEASLAIGLRRAGGWTSQELGFALWPTAWPLWSQVMLAVLIGELGYYWAHRLGHSWFWRLHATHHSVERLYWLNVVRFHPFDALLQLVGHVGPLALLGATPEVLAIVLGVTSVHGLLQHSNVDLRLGALNWIFSTAHLHRWHHANREQNCNFGQVLVLYDLIFGTRSLPAERPPAAIGLGPQFPRSYLAQLASPLRRDLFSAPSEPLR